MPSTKVNSMKQYCSVCKDHFEMEVVKQGSSKDVVWLKCPGCQGFLPCSMEDAAEQGKSSEAPKETELALEDLDIDQAKEYSDSEIYEIGEVLHHRSWNDYGKVVSKDELPGNRRTEGRDRIAREAPEVGRSQVGAAECQAGDVLEAAPGRAIQMRAAQLAGGNGWPSISSSSGRTVPPKLVDAAPLLAQVGDQERSVRTQRDAGRTQRPPVGQLAAIEGLRAVRPHLGDASAPVGGEELAALGGEDALGPVKAVHDPAELVQRDWKDAGLRHGIAHG